MIADEARQWSMRRQIAAVRRLHQQYRPAFDHPDVCSHCTRGMDLVDWPCPTIQALDSPFRLRLELKASVLDALYNEYGKYMALAERTSHNTRMAYHDKADGVLKAILVVEHFDFDAVYLRESARDLSDIPESQRRRIDADFDRAYQRAREIRDGNRSALP